MTPKQAEKMIILTVYLSCPKRELHIFAIKKLQ